MERFRGALARVEKTAGLISAPALYCEMRRVPEKSLSMVPSRTIFPTTSPGGDQSWEARIHPAPTAYSRAKTRKEYTSIVSSLGNSFASISSSPSTFPLWAKLKRFAKLPKLCLSVFSGCADVAATGDLSGESAPLAPADMALASSIVMFSVCMVFASCKLPGGFEISLDLTRERRLRSLCSLLLTWYMNILFHKMESQLMAKQEKSSAE
mmetsp:Transcript_24291/g.52991  ORF Transcript_24291/g.52991 Transcript_24291/m.52991 type:complete len:210 (-) Transcript_24291:2296-2925(-)